MNILILGKDANLAEAQSKFGDSHSYQLSTSAQTAAEYFKNCDVIFDFNPHTEGLNVYSGHSNLKVFLNSSYSSVAELVSKTGNAGGSDFFGFCGLPTFLNRPVMEVSCYDSSKKDTLEKLCKSLNTDFAVVDDRVGLVTPRIICMIINEAYYTVQEGTATKQDIDMAMKLGTNYPYGPFEWTKMIGATHVYKLLEAVYEDTHDERYKICPLLKREQ